MPSKGKRVASRQSNLRRRRGNAHRHSAGRSGGPAGVAVADQPTTGPVPSAPETTAGDPGPAASPAARSRPISQPQGRRLQRPAAYNHVGSELRRIGIFSGVLLAALVAVSFVL